MAKKDIEEEFEEEEERPKRGRKPTKNKRRKVELKDDTRASIWGICFLILGVIILLSIFDLAGVAGDFVYSVLKSLFGIGYYLLPILSVFVGIAIMRKSQPQVAALQSITALAALVSTLSIIHIADNAARSSGSEAVNMLYSGYVGTLVAWPFVRLFGIYAAIIILGAILVISLIAMFDESPDLVTFWVKIREFFSREVKSPFTKKEPEDYHEEAPQEPEVEEVQQEEIPYEEEESMGEEEMPLLKSKKFKSKAYIAPPLELLEKDKGKPNVGDLKGNMNIIQRTLLNFGISVEMDEVTIGPTVTRYALKPAQGMKLSRILGLQNDLALALAAQSIRIEAPIPGKSLVGIEIPNKVKSMVGLGTLLSDDKFQNSPKPLTIALGRGLSGKAAFANLAKMPHALIAGTTGSGKSVTVHSIIMSLLYRNGPEDLRLILVDPKRVELTLYNKIPHLLTPVITDPKKTILSLKWAAKEMDRRYDVLQQESVRDIDSYHSTVYNKRKNKDGEEAERMPYIVIIIDELADIMQAYPRELEGAIVRLAQMSRAVGIHLILSTQRPSVNVITGLIKANVPTRMALQVASQIDSRTILDQAGAEKLLGAGDMLYASGEMSQPERIQNGYVSEDEVKRVVEYLKKAYEDEIPNTIELSGSVDKGSSMFSDNLGDDNADDDLYEDARLTVIESGKASTSYLQRKLGVGYARAAKLIDMLEERGVVGAGNGAKPREVLEKAVDNTADVEI
jgi:DNA segregation ATPase FtsK/SpoIIIE, S-DNA-T family